MGVTGAGGIFVGLILMMGLIALDYHTINNDFVALLIFFPGGIFIPALTAATLDWSIEKSVKFFGGRTR